MSRQAKFTELPKFAVRLREVRRAMGMNQAEFGALGGVVMNSQNRYEAGATEPSAAYLANLAEEGVDIRYLLIGRRSTDSLPLLAERMLATFLEFAPAIQEALLTSADALHTAISPPQAEASEKRQSLHAPRMQFQSQSKRPENTD